ncbi:hypothetical protein J6590_090434 [Homalodisca vitripennis]|nr:hypothetical protein J6590_090434 [Homalodisca vitripennis]
MCLMFSVLWFSFVPLAVSEPLPILADRPARFFVSYSQWGLKHLKLPHPPSLPPPMVRADVLVCLATDWMGLTEALGARSGQDVWVWPLVNPFRCRCRGFHVELRAPRYVSFGNSALLKCDYSVPEDELHKVEWLHQNRKIWQYVKGRNPPFRNYSTIGSVIDVSHKPFII